MKDYQKTEAGEPLVGSTEPEVSYLIPKRIMHNIVSLGVSGLNPTVYYSQDIHKMTENALQKSRYSIVHILSELMPFFDRDSRMEVEAIITKYMIDSKESK
jgi:hypothetical protein